MKQNIVIAILIVAIILIFGYILQDVMGNPINSSKEQDIPVAQNTTMQPEEKVTIEDIQVGNGQEAKSGDTVVMHYNGTLEDGTKFDSSYDRGQPFTTQIGVGQVIKGWDEGVPGMKVGGKRKLIIPASLGYGAQGVPPTIPGNATLVFEVELLEIK